MSVEKNQPRPSIPVHEREVIDAEAKKFGGDYDKVSTTSSNRVQWYGIEVYSRYADAGELELMLDMIGEMTPAERSMVQRIYCDSKRGNDFAVELRTWNEGFATALAQSFSRVACSRSHGHSGISVHDGDMFGGGPSIAIEAEFPDGFEPNDIDFP